MRKRQPSTYHGAAAIDLGDVFSFEVRRTPALDAAAGFHAVRYSVRAELAGRRFEQFPVDVALGETAAVEPEQLHAPGLLAFADIEAPELPFVAVEQHVTENCTMDQHRNAEIEIREVARTAGKWQGTLQPPRRLFKPPTPPATEADFMAAADGRTSGSAETGSRRRRLSAHRTHRLPNQRCHEKPPTTRQQPWRPPGQRLHQAPTTTCAYAPPSATLPQTTNTMAAKPHIRNARRTGLTRPPSPIHLPSRAPTDQPIMTTRRAHVIPTPQTDTEWDKSHARHDEHARAQQWLGEVTDHQPTDRDSLGHALALTALQPIATQHAEAEARAARAQEAQQREHRRWAELAQRLEQVAKELADEYGGVAEELTWTQTPANIRPWLVRAPRQRLA